jgi:cytochrome c oxidase subunit 3
MSTAKIDRRVDHSHHFSSMEQEYEAGKQGVWIFMATEIMMFGGLFVAYFIYRFSFPEMYTAGGDSLNWKIGAFNTLVLLFSSFTMAQAVTETMKGENKKALKLVIITTLCALTFMVIKYFEYKAKFSHGLFPGFDMWNPDMEYIKSHIRDPELMGAFSSTNLRLFYVLYFAMTGLHGIHILVGVGLMIWLMKRLKNNEFSSKYYTAVEGVGLYWHIVDIIWIFLFPLMYLI